MQDAFTALITALALGLLSFALPVGAQEQSDGGGRNYYHGPVEAEASEISFTDGSTIEYFSWPSSQRLLLWAVNEAGAILWEHDLATGTRDKVLTSSRVDELLGAETDFNSVEFKLSPDGDKLALWRSPEAPLADPFFGVIDLSEPQRRLYRFSNVSEDFQVGAFAWGERSEYLYVAAAPYSGPQNPFSLGRFSMKNRAFVGLLNRDQVDLIEQLDYHAPSNSLVFASRAIGSDYPVPPTKVLGVVELDGMEVRELGRFTRISDLHADPVEDRVYFTARPEDSNGNDEIDAGDKTVGYRAPLGGGEPEPVREANGLTRRFRHSPGGEYLAWLQIYHPLFREPEMTDQSDLWVRRADDGSRYRVVAWAEDFRFAPDSSRMAVLVDRHRRLLLFRIDRRTG